MTEFTALHRLTGSQPGPLTEEMIDRALVDGTRETADLDWKRDVPPASGLSQTDVVKDIAAMANSGGGVLVFGVAETNGAASKRFDVGEITESYRRALASVAISAISPPVFGLRTEVVGEHVRSLILVIPSSVAGPHLIYRNSYFGAPLRNGPDTVWMPEAQIAAAYRARFEAQRESRAALVDMYAETQLAGDSESEAWMFGVARPSPPSRASWRPDRAEAITRFSRACDLNAGWLGGQAYPAC